MFANIASELYREVGAIVAAPVLSSEPDLIAALESSVRVQSQANALVAAAVERARHAGRTWQDIGAVLGVTRQAAFQKFGKPIDPRTGDTLSMSPLAEASELAHAVIENLAHGNWDAIESELDPQMRERLSAQALATAWTQVIGTAGAYESHSNPITVRAADLTVTNTQMAFEAADFTARIIFHDDHTIAGLFILSPEPAL